jgi:hypothetical protein
MITVTLPVKYRVSPVLVIIVTEGCPNWRIRSSRGVPRGTTRPGAGTSALTGGEKNGLIGGEVTEMNALTGGDMNGWTGAKTGFVGTNAVGDGLTKADGMIVVPEKIT